LSQEGVFRSSSAARADKAFLSKVANRTATEGFDIIIDDASHIGELTRTTFWHLFDHHLKPGGLYAIEDWGTGYLVDFPDGKKFDPKPPMLSRVRSVLPRPLSRSVVVPTPCHSCGMVGFIKELVDEQGAPASRWVTKPVGGGQSSKMWLLHRVSFSSRKPRPLSPLFQTPFLRALRTVCGAFASHSAGPDRKSDTAFNDWGE
jgi:hypothetical protein